MEAEIREARLQVRAEQAKKSEPEALFNLQLMQAEPAGAPLDGEETGGLCPVVLVFRLRAGAVRPFRGFSPSATEKIGNLIKELTNFDVPYALAYKSPP